MTDDINPPGTVSMEYFLDTVNDYIRQGYDRDTAIALAAEDGIELVESREE